MGLPNCCAEETRRTLQRHPDIATCDGCGSLLLAYDDDRTLKLTTDELTTRGADYSTGTVDGLRVVAKRQ